MIDTNCFCFRNAIICDCYILVFTWFFIHNIINKTSMFDQQLIHLLCNIFLFLERKFFKIEILYHLLFVIQIIKLAVPQIFQLWRFFNYSNIHVIFQFKNAKNSPLTPPSGISTAHYGWYYYLHHASVDWWYLIFL
jgi:hypothetical protein